MSRDPTATGSIRSAFRAEAQRRLGRLRTLVRIAVVDQGMLGHGPPSDPMMLFAARPREQLLRQFTEWFNGAVYTILVAGGVWPRPYLDRSYAQGLEAARRELGRNAVAADLLGRMMAMERTDALYHETVKNDLEGIADETVKQVSRAVSVGLVTRLSASALNRAIADRLAKIAAPRLDMMANTLTVAVNNVARLDLFRAIGLERVGLIPETVPRNPRLVRDAGESDYIQNPETGLFEGSRPHGVAEEESANRHFGKVRLGTHEYPVRTTQQGIDEDYVRGAAVVEEDGSLAIFHVTDDPDRVIRGLEAAPEHLAARFGNAGDDLGAGFYGSAAPEIWKSRSADKWNFIERMTTEQKTKYVEAIRNKIDEQRRTRYITQSEHERATRDLGYFAEGKIDDITWSAEQPYNIASWKPDFLKPLGIEPGKQPAVIKINLRGAFVDLSNGGFGQSDLRVARGMGFDGAYTKGSFSHVPQFVVWRKKAIVAVEGRRLHHRDHMVRDAHVHDRGPPPRQKTKAPREVDLSVVEVLTAADDDVCDLCSDLAAGGPYELDEAEGLIPVHCNCRCVWVPAYDLRFAPIIEQLEAEE